MHVWLNEKSSVNVMLRQLNCHDYNESSLDTKQWMSKVTDFQWLNTTNKY